MLTSNVHLPISTFPLKNIISTESTLNGENIRKEQCLACEHNVLVWDMFAELCRTLWTLKFIHEHRQDWCYNFCMRSKYTHSSYKFQMLPSFCLILFTVTLQTEEPLLQDIWCQEKCHFSRIRCTWVKLHVFLHLTLEDLKMFQERNFVFRT